MNGAEVYRILIHKEMRGTPAAVPPEAVSAVIVDYANRLLAEVTVAQHQALLAAGYTVDDMRTQPKIRVGMEALEPLSPEEGRAAAARSALDVHAEAMLGPSEPNYYFVQFIGPIKPEWLDTLRAIGLEPLAYYHDYAYLVYGSAAAIAQAAAQPFIRGYLPYRAEFTMPEMVRAAIAGSEAAHEIWLSIFMTSDVHKALQDIQAMGVEILEEEPPAGFYQRFHARVPTAMLDELAAMPAVYALEPFRARQAEDEVATQILAGNLNELRRPLVGYRTWLQAMGLDGSGVTIGINDFGIDGEHPAFAGRLKKIFQPVSSHGTMVAGQAAANYVMAIAPDTDADLADPGGFFYGIGVAPGADLIDVQTARECVTTPGVTSGDVGRILNNSWGIADVPPMPTVDYRSEERKWDLHVRNADPRGPMSLPLIVCFSAGNSGSQGLTRPKANKNSIVTGNFETYRPDRFGADADDINNRVLLSSIGNCGDGRVKPDVVAPGEHTASAALPPGDISHYLRFGGGTSAASPQTAGACALIVQWWRQRHITNGVSQTPSPAMVKALLINGAVDTRAGGPIPNMEQGWGRVHLTNIFNPSIPAIYLDQDIVLRPDNPPVMFEFDVADPARPLKITLVWTDAAGVVNTGTLGNPALINALGLRVTQDNHTWFGNNFAGGWSQTGGTQDAIQSVLPGRIVNNVQNIFIQQPTGRYAIHISPELIAGDCMSVEEGTASSDFKQDFALVIQNARLAPGTAPFITVVTEAGQAEESGPPDLTFSPLLAGDRRFFALSSVPEEAGVEAIAAGLLQTLSGAPLRRKSIILAGGGYSVLSDPVLDRLRKECLVHTVATGMEVDGTSLEAIAQAGRGTFRHVYDEAQVALLYDSILAAESGLEVVSHAAGVLDESEQLVQFPVIASDDKLFCLVHYDRSEAAPVVSLIRPSSAVIDPAHARRSSLVDFQATANGAAYTVARSARRKDAWEGEWSVRLRSSPGTPATHFTLSVLAASSLRLNLAWDKTSYTVGETMKLAAQVTDTGAVLTQGLRLLVRTEVASQGTVAAREQEAAVTFALNNDDKLAPALFDTPHAAMVRIHLRAGEAGIHDHMIQVAGTTASGAHFTRTRLVSHSVAPPATAAAGDGALEDRVELLPLSGSVLAAAPRSAFASVSAEVGESVADAVSVQVGKVAELCYSGDGAFLGFRLQTVHNVIDVSTHGQRIAQVLTEALARNLTVVVVPGREPGILTEVRLLPA